MRPRTAFTPQFFRGLEALVCSSYHGGLSPHDGPILGPSNRQTPCVDCDFHCLDRRPFTVFGHDFPRGHPLRGLENPDSCSRRLPQGTWRLAFPDPFNPMNMLMTSRLAHDTTESSRKPTSATRIWLALGNYHLCAFCITEGNETRSR